MKTVARWYVMLAVVVFTFCVPVMGRSPAGWVLHALGWVTQHAPQMSAELPTVPGPDFTAH